MFAERVVDNLQPTVNFTSLASFKLTIQDVDFPSISDVTRHLVLIYRRCCTFPFNLRFVHMCVCFVYRIFVIVSLVFSATAVDRLLTVVSRRTCYVSVKSSSATTRASP